MVRLIGSSIYSKETVENFWNIHFSCVIVDGRFVDSNMDGFSSFPCTLFAVFVYYFVVH